MNDELERRIEELENQVTVLREALASMIDWSPRITSLRWTEADKVSARLEGQQKTREILNRLG